MWNMYSEFRKGKQIHGEIICKRLLEENVMLGNAFVDMYVKWDDLEKAQMVFVNHGHGCLLLCCCCKFLLSLHTSLMGYETSKSDT